MDKKLISEADANDFSLKPEGSYRHVVSGCEKPWIMHILDINRVNSLTSGLVFRGSLAEDISQ
ncbi:hypothetical protein GCM10027180_29270 [Microbulbifer echini]